MKLRPLHPTLLATGVLVALSGCATLRNLSSPTFAKIRRDGPPVAITTNPVGAMISVDGNPVGVSPVKTRLSPAKPHLVTASKDGAGEAAAIMLPATKEQPARRFDVSITDGLSETTGFAPGELSLTLKPVESVDATTATLKTVHQSDELEAAGKLTKQEHTDLDRKIIEFYSR